MDFDMSDSPTFFIVMTLVALLCVGLVALFQWSWNEFIFGVIGYKRIGFLQSLAAIVLLAFIPTLISIKNQVVKK